MKNVIKLVMLSFTVFQKMLL